jgi:hypothetical protein
MVPAGWVLYALNMMDIALEIAKADSSFEDSATKFFEHFVLIAEALNELGLWCPEDKFFYDVLTRPGAEPLLMRIQSVVGLSSLFAVSIIDKKTMQLLPDFTRRTNWFEKYRKRNGKYWPNEEKAEDEKILVSLIAKERLLALIERMINEAEFYRKAAFVPCRNTIKNIRTPSILMETFTAFSTTPATAHPTFLVATATGVALCGCLSIFC